MCGYTSTFSEDVQTTKENRCAVHKELEVQTRKKYKQNTPTHAYKVCVENRKVCIAKKSSYNSNGLHFIIQPMNKGIIYLQLNENSLYFI